MIQESNSRAESTKKNLRSKVFSKLSIGSIEDFLRASESMQTSGRHRLDPNSAKQKTHFPLDQLERAEREEREEKKFPRLRLASVAGTVPMPAFHLASLLGAATGELESR